MTDGDSGHFFTITAITLCYRHLADLLVDITSQWHRHFIFVQ